MSPAVAAVRLAVRRTLAGPTGDPTVDPVGGPVGGPVLVACSGGADSLALLAGAAVEGHRVDVRVVGVTVDHGLQEGSADRASRVVAQMAGLGADETVSVRVTVNATGQGPEAAAREARYAVLEEVAQRFGSPRVLLGHTLDDQAETVLLGLARGSGGRSLAGMRRGFDVFARPLLDVTRAQTEAACRAEDIEWWDDPHNDDPRFTRSRVRRTVLPTLETELGPGVAAALARTADQLRRDASALDELADRALAQSRVGPGEGPAGLDVGSLQSQHEAVLHRVLRRAALDAGASASELGYAHVLAVAELVLASTGPARARRIQLPGHVTVRRQGDVVAFGPTETPGPAGAVPG